MRTLSDNPLPHDRRAVTRQQTVLRAVWAQLNGTARPRRCRSRSTDGPPMPPVPATAPHRLARTIGEMEALRAPGAKVAATLAAPGGIRRSMMSRLDDEQPSWW
jgi:hypothetical protein